MSYITGIDDHLSEGNGDTLLGPPASEKCDRGLQLLGI
jgi:hypothetical protein